MKIITSYSARITASKCKDVHAVTDSELRHALERTVDIYRRAVDFFIDVTMLYWDEISAVGSAVARVNKMEALTIVTEARPSVVCPFGKGEFYKMPSYLRRAAIADALGKVSSYKSNLSNWEKDPKGKTPSAPKAGYAYPSLYQGNSFKKVGEYTVQIKLFVHNTWDWATVKLRKSDIDYINKHCSGRKKLCPTLMRRGRVWSLDFAFKEKVELTDTVNTILAVDFGINNACVCSAMRPDGTILGRDFLSLPEEQDSLTHALNRIKKAQQNGAKKMPCLWAKAKGINSDIASKTAKFIIDKAVYYNADVIVFEFLDLNKKKRGSKKQKLHMWKAKAAQRIVTDQAHRLHMHISHVCAWGTSRLAYDGSGKVERGIDGNHSICRFKSGKIYNCDLSASYNIGARYFVREIVKSLPEKVGLALEAKVPQAAKRSTCTYSTLISLVAELEGLALPADGDNCVPTAVQPSETRPYV